MYTVCTSIYTALILTNKLLLRAIKKIQFLLDLLSSIYARSACKKSSVAKCHLKVMWAPLCTIAFGVSRAVLDVLLTVLISKAVFRQLVLR